MKTILLLGGNGTLGKHLSKTLCNKYSILTYNKRFRRGEQQQTELLQLIKEKSVDFILNSIGATNVQRCEVDKEYAYEGNILVPKVISEIQDYISSPISVINFSTDQVYDGSGNSLESDARPVNNYGRSKLLGEQELAQNCCNFRVNYVSSSSNRLSFSDWIIETARNKSPVSLFTDIFFNPVDLETITLCVDRALSENIVGTFNIGATQKISKADFYLKFSKRLGFDNPYVELTRYNETCKTPRPLDMSMNISKALNENFSLPSLENVMSNLQREFSYEN